MSRTNQDENSTQARIRRSRDDMGKPEHSTVPAPIEAISFDVTHTLIHCPRLVEIYSEVMVRHGLDAAPADIRRVIPRVWQELSCRTDPRVDRFTRHRGGERGWWHRFLERVCQHLEIAPPTRFASAELFDRFAKAESWEVYPDVVPVLEALAAKPTRLGVVSNWDHRLPRLLERLGLDRFFDAVVYSSACGVEKPHPLIFEHCLHELGVAPERAAHVGDHALEDVEGAEGAGMRALRIDRREGSDDLCRLLAGLLEAPLSWRGAVGGKLGGDRDVRG